MSSLPGPIAEPIASSRAGTTTLRITEIFRSLQGEGRHTGLPTCFVRLTGCPLRCHYCDTAYAFQGGERMAIEDILDDVAQRNVRHVCVTGGEPLAQPGCSELLSVLCDAGYHVSIETSGAIDFRGIDARVLRVVDIKTPASGEADRQLWEALGSLRADEQVKFVVSSRADYDWALQTMRDQLAECAAEVLLSPAVPMLAPAQLADWVVEDAPPARFQVQLHKMLWGDVAGR